ncbi:putative cationic amino acid transporter [Tieghemostelium lacteum]|uniref:Putative cationic amino acid transporter n=1 Tax=Tieghemostelium lacteum TaxID=361077 RepID=A0A151Z3X8_TIELA|nr:putative cationic amino acid transporter [Tieghemostelium lacteum]|eukprot:KYQ88673.1 putative cationic amino acid transporter [Tieghemostelium lacteum]
MGDSQPLIRNRKSVYRWESLTRRYPIEEALQEEEANTAGLNKCLTAIDIISYGVGSTVGAGVFVSIGNAIQTTAGPGTLLSFVFAAFACLISAFCYSEFSTKIPVSGSAYSFAYVALGEFTGWFIGWNLTLEYAISASAVARGWAGYFETVFSVFNKTAPEWITGYSINSVINFAPIAPAIIIVCTIVLIFGVKDSSRFNLAITCVNIVTILFFIILGAIHVDYKNWNPFLPFGFAGVFKGCSRIFFSFVGFDSVTTLSGEVKNPKRDLPIGIVGTLIIATSLYVGVSLVLSGVVNYVNVNLQSPLSSAFISIDMRWAAGLVAMGTLTSLTASTLCSLLGQPRIYLQMAKDGLFFKKFAEVDPKTQVPIFGTVFTGVFASILAVSLNLDELSNMISIGTLLAFTVVCAGVVVLRFRDDNGVEPYRIQSPIFLLAFFIIATIFGLCGGYSWSIAVQIPCAVLLVAIIVFLTFFRKQQSVPTTFKCPLVPVVPLVGIFVNTYIIMQLDIASLYRVIVWTALGSVIYFGYGIRNSKLNRMYDDEVSNSINQ